VCEAHERFGLGGMLALGHDRRGWHGGRGRASPGPGEMQHDEEPDESQQSEMIVKQGEDHGIAPYART
jgi:hypothetical protein